MAAVTGYGLGVKLEIAGEGTSAEPFFLTCNCGATDCDHRKAAIKDGADAEGLWTSVTEKDHMGGEFALGVILADGAVVKAWVNATASPSLYSVSVSDLDAAEIDCGLITVNSGMWDLRNKILDGVSAADSDPEMCHAAFHRRNAPQGTTLDLVCRTLWGFCWSCRKRKPTQANDPDQPDYSDLNVPF